MAPEQAAADPHVDHRADLYAVGAMAYEMLCGRPPFSGMSPQQVLAAHVTLPPAPLERPAHERAAGAQRARDALPREEAGGSRAERGGDADAAPGDGDAERRDGADGRDGQRAAFTSGAEAALRRANPARVAVLFALASIAVLAVVFVLRQRLGLPDWVLPGAAVLLAIGLPIMLVTGARSASA